VTEDEAEALALVFEARHGVTMTIGSLLTDEGYVPWLAAARANINPYYWNRYKQLLAEKGFSSHVLATLDSVTDRILNALENPAKAGPWDRRGLVVGHVQSGKTANYTGLICKAADAGYRLIVVIAGVHNNLRNQTQQRIDEGFVGRDSARLLSSRQEQFIGVGNFDKSRRPVTFTNSVKDFSKITASGVGIPLQNLNEPAVFVIKKNSKTLTNLLEWLTEHSARIGTATVETPMLLIDDEADNASINTRAGEEIARINGQIRGLLKLFDRSCYVGYTATPFANIFIDPKTNDEMLGQDLFPRHFIVGLDPPTNYFGANRVFLQEPDQIVRPIDDNEDTLPISQTKGMQLSGLPPSLVAAVRAFIVARAIRLARGQAHVHCSMLVNASRFTDVQRQLRNEIHQVVEAIKGSVRVNGARSVQAALHDPEIAALREVWNREYESTTEFKWEEIQAQLHASAAPISVVEVNSRSSGSLNYSDHAKTGLNVIAVGGYSLSRGLTLEGLMVSYFLRNSIMYDTLMQMGRWFGYRAGYEDLCRVWMPEEAEGWYAHISESIDELREELRSMEAANATPEQFGLKVRSHPDTLIVTARNKMGSGKRFTVRIGLANRFVETAILKYDSDSLNANRMAARQFAQSLASCGFPLSGAKEVTGGWFLTGIPVDSIERFITEFRNHPGSMLTEPGPILRYISERRETELASWDILFAAVRHGSESTLRDTSLGIEILCQRRAPGTPETSSTLRVTNKQRVASRGIEKTGLTIEQIQEAEREYFENIARNAPSPSVTNYPDHIYRAKRSRPLLIVHLLGIGKEGDDLSKQEPVVAWSISFPGTDMKETLVEYVVNYTWLQENQRDDMDEEEMNGDEN
jgi:hypothetical protein